MDEASAKLVAVIGCGNANRSDDAAGLEVVRQLYSREWLRQDPRVHLFDAGTDGMGVMFAARGCTHLVLVDACRTGAEPGSLFDVPGEELQTKPPHSFNLHDFRWDHALSAGRRIYADSFPKTIKAMLIEAENVDFGVGLTPKVRASAFRAATLIENDIRAYLRDTPGATVRE